MYSTRTGSDVTVVNTTGDSLCALAEERTGQAVVGGTTLFVVRRATRSSIDLRFTKIQVQ